MLRSTATRLTTLSITFTVLAGILPSVARLSAAPPDDRNPAAPIQVNKTKGSGPLAKAVLAGLPLRFEPNRGQSSGEVKFLAKGSGFAAFLTSTEAVLKVPGRRIAPDPGAAYPQSTTSPPSSLRMKFLGANPDVKPVGFGRLSGATNYFTGNDPARWVTGVKSLSGVKYANIYKGVDLVFYGNTRHLEYDFVVRPGANPAAISLGFAGAKGLKIDSRGDLVIKTPSGTIRHNKPVLYQNVQGRKRSVTGKFLLKQGRLGFHVGDYDRKRTLVIDPILQFSSFIGGSNEDEGTGVTVDAAGNIYVTGSTLSNDFPTEGPFQPAQYPGSRDGFVTKISEESGIVYSTYLGGSEPDVPRDIAVDSSGNAYVAGTACSTNFPTQSPYQESLAATGGSCDAFLTKLSPTGASLVYSTYLGGSRHTEGRALAIDASGNAYISGQTYSTNFPTAGAAQAANAGTPDSFLTKFNPAGSALVYSTYLGGAGADNTTDIALDSSGNAYLTGDTQSSNYPTVNPFQSNLLGQSDAVVSKLNSAGNSLVYASYFGGSDSEEGRGIAVDSSSNMYLTGGTASADLPTQGPVQGRQAANDGFAAKLNSSGSSLVWSTYLGGQNFDIGKGIGLDSTGAAYVSGATASADFPTADAFQPAFGGGGRDAFVTRLAPDGSALSYSTFLGGVSFDEANALATDSNGNAYVTGFTGFTQLGSSNNFTLVRPADDVWADTEAFVSRVGLGAAHYSNFWSATVSPALPRFSHTATTLPNGRVLVAGGCAAPTSPDGSDLCKADTATTELFDPTVGLWIPGAPMGAARSGHTSTLLAGGKVLVVGGCLPPTQAIDCLGSPSSEIYDPVLGVWAPVRPLLTGRRFHTATLLPDGRVLVAGGKSGSTSLSGAEIFDPATGLWSTAGSLAQNRHNQSASLLANGKVLVAGGESGPGILSSAELFNPATGTWAATGSLPSVRTRHTSTALANGTVLVAGGSNATTSTRSAVLYDPGAGSWSTTGALALARSTHTATVLASGKVLVAGGRSAPGQTGRARVSAELYDPATGGWSRTMTMLNARSGSATAPQGHTASLLQNGKVLVAGGYAGVVTELFAAQSDMSISLQDAPDPVTLGEELTYTATVTNHGLSSASAVAVTQALPSGASFVSAGASQGSCSYGSGTVSCTLGSLSKGATATVTVVIEPNTAGVATSTATVTANEEDPRIADNSATSSTTVSNTEGCTIIGTGGNDTLTGTNDPDVICGLGGNDTISGLGGDDRLLGGSGNDSGMNGDGGADILEGGKGDDTLNGGMGDDQLTGGSGSDTMNGNGGDDTLNGADGVSANDTLDGGSGADTCSADTGDTLTSC